MPEIPETIKRLVDTFARNIDSYKSGNMNETQIRREFIDPFFITLGWDVENKKGYADAYKDVIHEYSLKTKDVREAPDYCFRIGGMRKFFVEAKKPSINVKEDIHPAFQVRSYAWSAKLPLSILTDFEEFAVYDCRIPPNKNDKASVARVMYFTYDQYFEKWEEISGIFSSDAVQKGSFDKYVESNKKKKGTAEVDSFFLDEMEEWRKLVARNIALRNPAISIRELNFVVQKTIDRIIFLRICEDRGIEDYGQLMALQNGTNIYERLKQVFHRADERYNSGLFHFTEEKERGEDPDNLSLTLQIDDKVLKDIFKNLYYPDSPYEFSVLPSDILGQVYEQFLGKIIRLTPSHQAVIEDKPEVKKAGGVYYTPTYIVDYIVENTLGKLISSSSTISSPLPKGRTKEGFATPAEVSKIKILDPACGSGSFLIGAFQYLLNWHLKQYTVDTSTINKILASKQPAIYQAQNGGYLLTTAEKKRILLNNIYGVDIDSQAVEVTKLSLLLKVLEGESEETITNQMKFFRERALPDLSNNIKCGNSLIGPDFYDQMEMQFLDDEEKLRINVFDWETEFKEIMDNGGFDVVIGNPPWVDIKGMEPHLVDYYFEKYSSTENRMNIYATFLEKGISLTNENGLTSYITPNSFYTQSSYINLRKCILDSTNFSKIVRLPDNTFKNVIAESTISVFEKGYKKDCEVLLYKADDNINQITYNNVSKFKTINTLEWKDNKDFIFNIYTGKQILQILYKIESNKVKLADLCDFSLGITPYDKYRGHSQEQIKNRVFHSKTKKDKTFKPLLSGANITRYNISWNQGEYISYGSWLGAPREERFFKEKRIIIRQIISGNPLRIYGGYTNKEYYNAQIAFNLVSKENNEISLKYILGILNSNLMSFYHKSKFLDQSKKTFQKILIQDAKRFPIQTQFSQKNYDNLVVKVDQMIGQINKLEFFQTPQEKTALQRQIDATDKQIDQLVYQLYGLTEEEIKIVEGE